LAKYSTEDPTPQSSHQLNGIELCIGASSEKVSDTGLSKGREVTGPFASLVPKH